MTTSHAAILLAAGRSTRMKSNLPKVLHGALGLPLVEHVVRAAQSVGADRIVVVVSPDHQEAVAAALSAYPNVSLAVQAEARGTAHAVLAAKDALEGFSGTGLIMMGDAPCISPDSLRALLAEHAERAAQVSVLSGTLDDPTGYGRVVRGPDGDVEAIVEQKDASEAVRAIREINAGTYAIELPLAWETLAKVEPSPATGELYLTDILQHTRSAGGRVHAVLAAGEGDVLGVNTRAQLARVTAVLRERINAGHMANGVTIVDPQSAFIDARAEIEPDARIEPFVVVQGACKIARGAVLGPFAHVRGDSRIGEGTRVGNFVEVVRSTLGKDARALHLSYVGDGTVGDGANVGAGTIFANWDGERHLPSEVEAGASLGSNTVLVGPCKVGAGSRTGAGAVVVKTEIPAGATYVGVPARGLPSAAGGEA